MGKATYNKYRAKAVYVNGERFDSKKEAKRYQELLLLQRAKEISNLRRQVKYELIPSFTLGGRKYRGINYYADFVYIDSTGREIIEDTKGVQTDVYKIKKKLMAYLLKLSIKEL